MPALINTPPKSEQPERSTERDPGRTPFIDIAQLVPRPVRPDELAVLRSIYWRLAALGHRLPAEIDVIVIEGGTI